MTDVVLELAGVSKGYGTRRKVQAVSNISLALGAGEILSLVGPSGCGKSTILKMAAGLLSADSGLVRLGDMMPTDYARVKGIGYVSQTPALLPWRTVSRNLTLPLELKSPGASLTRIQRKPEEILELVGIREFADLYPNQLSGGIAQRAAVARAMLAGGNVIFMDEPFSALDAITRERLWFEISSIFKREGIAVLLVTHNIAEAVAMSDRVLILSARPGKVVGEFRVDGDWPRTSNFLQADGFRIGQARVRELLFGSDQEASP
jgi:NitT/TauT family transport system ATP-binding protein